MFSSTVTDHWFHHGELGDARIAGDTFRVVVDDDLPTNRRIMLLEAVEGDSLLMVSPHMACTLGVRADTPISEAALQAALRSSGLELNGADHLFYFPLSEQAAVCAERVPATVRQLTQDDANLFAAFAAQAPEPDLDEAFVEIDHWCVFGAFSQERLVCAASMYPWSDTRLADLGVITLPAFRGRGLARQAVRAMGAHALSLGYEPQYRCQPDNAASVALAASSGLSLFGRWDVVSSDAQ